MWFKVLLIGLFLSLNAFSGVPKILILASGQDKNVPLAKSLIEIGKEFGAVVTFAELEKLKLPLYTPQEEKNLGRFDRKRVKKLQKMFMENDGLVFCAPEYNGGIPPVLLNAIAWASKVVPGVWNKAFSGKGLIVCGESGGKGTRVKKIMKDQFSFAGMDVVPDSLWFDYKRKGSYKELKYLLMNRLIKRSIK